MFTYPYGNIYGTNYQQSAVPQYAQQIPQQIPQQLSKTNKIWVTSLEDAMARSVEPNSEYIYLHQDKPLLYEIKTDMQGKKTVKALELKDYVEPSIEPVKPKKTPTKDFITREEFDGFKNEIKTLLEKGEVE